jgi:hypothetical protein
MNETLTTNGGLDKLEVTILFLPILTSDGEDLDEVKKDIDKLIKFLSDGFKREITPEERIAMLEGCKNYVNTEPATNERYAAMEYLFNLKFLSETKIGEAEFTSRMKRGKLQKKPIKIGWQHLPRKRKKCAKKLLEKVINTDYQWEGKQ